MRRGVWLETNSKTLEGRERVTFSPAHEHDATGTPPDLGTSDLASHGSTGQTREEKPMPFYTQIITRKKSIEGRLIIVLVKSGEEKTARAFEVMLHDRGERREGISGMYKERRNKNDVHSIDRCK